MKLFDEFCADGGKVCQAHVDFLDPVSLSTCLDYIERYKERPRTNVFPTFYPALRLRPRVSESHYFTNIISNYLNPAFKSLHESLKESPQKLMHAAVAWIHVFKCCLSLYVPDRPFDPALRPLIERDRHNKREAELQAKSKALQDFQMIVTGQPTSLRSEMVQDQLQNLGDAPQDITIPRPRVSELMKLCGEFKNLLESIVFRCLDGSALRSFFDGDMAQHQELELLRSNISRIIPRISTSFAAYEDITKPLVAMLQGLDVGLAMALLASPTIVWSGSEIRCLSASTPFLGMQFTYYLETSLNDRKLVSGNDVSSRLKFLKNMALYRSVDRELTPDMSRKTCEVFHTIYQIWKERMEKDKHHNAKISSMYRYHDTAVDSVKTDEKDFLDIFPEFIECGENLDDTDKSQADQRLLAQQLASCHEDIFNPGKSTTHLILAILEEAVENLGNLWLHELGPKACNVPIEETVCAVVLGLSSHQNRLNESSINSKTYNFYVDANLTEAKNLIIIVQCVQTRFSDLIEAWPEHGAIRNILQASSELMSLRHVEPIARILTKTEQLHGFMHQWEAVASKEYSAINLYDQLTNLLISWRRLELSTWAQLLDMEDKRMDDDVKSWWFVAYEVIVAVPLSMINSGENIQIYSQQLFATLGEFLTTTSIGQYCRRLRLIEHFKRHVELLLSEDRSLNIIHDTLINFLCFYAPSEKPILEALCEGRTKLEKDMREVILLASWKDTNIDALRESARRSHHKLFKIIRKYRAILARPAEDVVGAKTLERIIVSERFVENIAPQILTQDQQAVEIGRKHIPNWTLKPARFTNSLSTVKKMKSMSQLRPHIIGCAFSLHEYTDELVRNIETLQKETPTKVVKEKEQSIKHLQTRKKKMYAETLRSVRQMGFLSNLSSNVLNQQASGATILGKCPSMPLVTAGIHFREIDFHRLVRLMPQVRKSVHKHSSDLNARDISRSIGYLESMLVLVIKRRSKLIYRLSDLNHLEEAISMLRNLWAPGKYDLQRVDSCYANTAKDQERVIRWLPGIIEAGCILAKKYSELTGYASTAVISVLERWRKELESLTKAYDFLPILPHNISSSMHEETHVRTKDLLSGFKAYLKEAMIDEPALNFVLRHIELWTEAGGTKCDTQAKDEVSVSLIEIDKIITEACDSILVATQRTQNIISLCHTIEGDPSWLLQVDALFFDCLSAFQSRKIVTMLKSAISKTTYVAAGDGGGLAAVGALWATAMPIIQQYRNSLRDIIGHYANFQQALCRLAIVLGDAFCRIASQGFCDPAEDAPTATENSEKLEEGTGLGEGEGETDISKDIRSDEDLTELAQEGNGNIEGDIDDQEDAVNMDCDELEGEIGDTPEEDKNSRDENEGEDPNIDDEVGDVDDLDPSAIDEKLWDGSAEETSEERQGSKETGGTLKDEQLAAEADTTTRSDHDDENEDDEMAENDDEENEEIEQVKNEEAEKVDPYLQEEQNLDLPKELDLTDEDLLSSVSESDLNSVEGSSIGDTEIPEEPKADDNTDDALAPKKAATIDEIPPPLEEKGEENLTANQEEHAESSIDMELEQNAGDLEQSLLQDHTTEKNMNPNNDLITEPQAHYGDDNQGAQDKRNQDNNDEAKENGKGDLVNKDDRVAPENEQLGKNSEISNRINGEAEQPEERSGNPAFKKLGDALERWHKRQREIQHSANEERASHSEIQDVEMADQNFEHLNDEQEVADTQALGSATHDQAHALDEQALKSQMHDEPTDFLPEQTEAQRPAEEDQQMMEDFENLAPNNEDHQNLSRVGATIVENLTPERPFPNGSTTHPEKIESDIDNLGTDLTTTHLHSADHLTQRTLSEASRLWAHYESLTYSLSLSLTEQLRLILAPTLAAKMRGDFRTGKRLNIKRIIPYIASNYKRDKIWMRRSIPSKRAYQILLAVDDSKSMSESQGGHLALETLALVAKSLSMLEAGEMCIVSFGADVHVAHPFDRTFSAGAGPATLQHFNFQQPHTDVKKLLQASLALFQDARQKSAKNGASDLWQLQLIVSDGICEDHDAIRRLVRSAQEERIVIAFVVVDAGKGESILDMSQAIFEPDPSGQDALGKLENASTSGTGVGASKLKIKRYLDGFPFPYYLVVGDVKELPGVLATALRQWFAEIVESS